ncbi:hypothetical protein [Chitinophaga sp.]|uniref:hypothetical protein n=1 Tax=Chitinophaga sp. TaxID=1869181 RepID=UPI0031E24026
MGNSNGGFFYFNGSKDYHLNYIYNLPDAGNFLFGVAAARMNISHDLVMWGNDRHEMIKNHTPDSEADIRAINAGFFYQQRFLEPQSKGNFLWRSYNTTRPTWFRNN